MTKLDWNYKFIEILNEEEVPPINLFFFLVQFLYDLSHDLSISVPRELTPLELSLVEMLGNVRDSLKPNLEKLTILKEKYTNDFEER